MVQTFPQATPPKLQVHGPQHLLNSFKVYQNSNIRIQTPTCGMHNPSKKQHHALAEASAVATDFTRPEGASSAQLW